MRILNFKIAVVGLGCLLWAVSAQAQCVGGVCGASSSAGTAESTGELSFYESIHQNVAGEYDRALTRTLETLKLYRDAERAKETPWAGGLMLRDYEAAWFPFQSCAFTNEDYLEGMSVPYEFLIYDMLSDDQKWSGSEYAKMKESLQMSYEDVLNEVCLPNDINARNDLKAEVQRIFAEQLEAERRRARLEWELVTLETYTDGEKNSMKPNVLKDDFDVIEDLNNFEKVLFGKKAEEQKVRERLGEDTPNEETVEPKKNVTLGSASGSAEDKENSFICEEKEIPEDVQSYVRVELKCFYNLHHMSVEANAVVGEPNQTPFCDNAVREMTCNQQVTLTQSDFELPEKSVFWESTLTERWKDFIEERAMLLATSDNTDARSELEGYIYKDPLTAESLRSYYLNYLGGVGLDRMTVADLSGKTDELVIFLDERMTDLMKDQMASEKISDLGIYTKEILAAIEQEQNLLAGVYDYFMFLSEGEKVCDKSIVPFKKIMSLGNC